jgi:predicted amidohydrolase
VTASDRTSNHDASVAQLPLRTTAGDAAVAWNYWAPRLELAHDHAVVVRDGARALMLRARGFESYGYWSTRVSGIVPGNYYRFEALHQSEGVREESGSEFAVLSWYAGAENNPRELQRDYIDQQKRAGQWIRAARTIQAPADAAFARIELGLRRTEGGAVYWRDVVFAETPKPAPRVVRIATTRIVPAFPATLDANSKLMADMLERVGPEKPDFVLLSENLLTRGVRLPLEERAQIIPGPLTHLLSAKAKKFGTHVITTLLERDGSRYHNTAVLIDRAGRIAGKYRKVHLTIGEMENGLTPGSEYPVFETDAGRIGIVTCWDNWFSEPMRILRLRGAEIVFMPLAGDGNAHHWEAVWSARAMDNGVYLVASSTVGETPSRILDPAGAIVAEAMNKFGYAVASIDLNREWRLRYLSVGNGTGEARSLYLRERRPETYAPLLKDSEVQR